MNYFPSNKLNTEKKKERIEKETQMINSFKSCRKKLF